MEDTHVLEARGGVQGDGAGVCAVADHGHHLTHPQGFAGAQQGVEKRLADAAPAKRLSHIDRVLDHEAIGGAQAVGSGIGVARDGSVDLGHQNGQAQAGGRGQARPHLVCRGDVQFERPRAVQHAVGVDGRDGRQVGFRERPNDHAFSQPLSTAQTAKA
ncbi:hypothetical protein D3C72_1305170 [compost metagenome]